MIRLSLIVVIIILAGCSSNSTNTISSMNYLQEPIDAVCVRSALADEDGFAAVTAIRRTGGAEQIEAIFNDDLPITVIVRRQDDGTGEVSVFTRISPDIDPLQRREAEYAVRAADEAIYRQCTTDGQLNPDGDGDVILDAQE